jgi:prephenate dehydrogenase
MQTVAIVGVGLIGGSFALALKQAGFRGRILGVSSQRTLSEALPLGVIDEPATLDEAAERADFIYLAQPIQGIISTLTELRGKVRPDCLITDAGSTKVNIVRHAISTVTASQFLGGHPMAGKESRGVLAADANLFRGKTYVLTPIGDDVLNTSQALAFLKWLKEIGAQTVTLTPEEHDHTVAFTSHLPQLISSALAATLGEHLNSDEQLRVAGSGLADTTRLALSSYDIWRDILETNTAEVDHALAVYIDKLTKFRQNLTTPQLRDEFCVAAETANKLRR